MTLQPTGHGFQVFTYLAQQLLCTASGWVKAYQWDHWGIPMD